MAKKKNNQTVINNIGSVNMEIDYDKLAEAIVRAQRKFEEIDSQEIETEVKVTFINIIKAIYLLLFKKTETKGLTTGIFAMLTSALFKWIGILGIAVSPLVIVGCVYFAYSLDWTFDVIFNNIIYLCIYTIIAGAAALIFLFSVLLIAASREIEREKDKNYIISVFSGVVSFAALVVALIALIKGVG